MNAYALFDTCEDILKVLNISEKQMSGVISVLLYELSQSRMLCKDDVIKHNINKYVKIKDLIYADFETFKHLCSIYIRCPSYFSLMLEGDIANLLNDVNECVGEEYELRGGGILNWFNDVRQKILRNSGGTVLLLASTIVLLQGTKQVYDNADNQYKDLFQFALSVDSANPLEPASAMHLHRYLGRITSPMSNAPNYELHALKNLCKVASSTGLSSPIGNYAGYEPHAMKNMLYFTQNLSDKKLNAAIDTIHSLDKLFDNISFAMPLLEKVMPYYGGKLIRSHEYLKMIARKQNVVQQLKDDFEKRGVVSLFINNSTGGKRTRHCRNRSKKYNHLRPMRRVKRITNRNNFLRRLDARPSFTPKS